MQPVMRYVMLILTVGLLIQALVISFEMNEILFLEVPALLFIWALGHREDNLGRAAHVFVLSMGLIAGPEAVYAAFTDQWALFAVDLAALTSLSYFSEEVFVDLPEYFIVWLDEFRDKNNLRLS